MALADIVHDDVLDTLIRQGGSDGFGHLFRIAVHTAVNDDYTLFSLVAAQLIVDGNGLGCFCTPDRSMGRTDGLDFQSGLFL